MNITRASKNKHYISQTMARQIKFRGYDGAEWHFGYYAQDILSRDRDGNHPSLITVSDDYVPDAGVSYPVIAATVGEFTGATDIYGTEIYEGDVVSDNGLKAEVIWAKTRPCLKYADGDTCTLYEGHGLTVLGNTHNTPDLIKL